ncbi:MAG: hypothetical protein P8N29_08015 [Saprospiraceae bacterium]|nr:hypothetical protein [Saprospiraceae bacterium]
MKDGFEIKRELYYKCTEYIDQRIELIQKKLDDVAESRSNETKSSAGDKHETGRTMMQLEEQKATVQLYAALEVKQTLNQLDVETTNAHAGLGSLVRCDTGSYFIAISAGKLVIEGTKYYGISLPSPIGLILAGKSVGDEVKYNDKVMKILEMC